MTKKVFLYLIFSHDQQRQVARLACAIRQLSPLSLIAVHHDPRLGELDQRLFAEIPSVFIVPNPVAAAWGDYSLVEQYIHSLRWCRENLRWDWISTVTGQSYPLRPLYLYERFVEESGKNGFVRYFDAMSDETWRNGILPRGEGERRYMYRYFKLPRFAYGHRMPAGLVSALHWAREKLNQIQPFVRVVPMPRGATRFGIRRWKLPFPEGFTLCCGRQSFQIDLKACDYVLDYLRRNPGYESFFKRCLIPDEGFFTTMLANAQGMEIISDALRYIKWSSRIGAARGAVIQADETEAALQSEKAFGLKFDENTAPDALSLVDQRLGILKNTFTKAGPV